MKKKKFDLYKTLRIVFLMLAILTMAMSIVGKGHAEEMSEGVLEFYENNVGNCDNIDWFLNRIGVNEETFKGNFGYVYVSELDNYLIVYFSKYKTSMPCLDCSTANLTIDFSTSSDSWVWGRSLSITNNISSGTTVGYELFIDKSTNTIQRYLYMKWNSSSRYKYSVNLYNSLGSSSYSYWVDWDNNVYDYYSYNNFAIPDLSNINLSTVKANFDYACVKPVVSNNMFALKVENITDFSEYIVSVYDDNFSIYKTYGVGGIDDPILNIEYLDNIFSQGYVYTDSTTYSLTFDVDGVESTVSISSTAYPDEFVEHSGLRTSFDLIYRMLSNKILNFSSASTVTLKQVSMTATAYPTSNQQGTLETVTKSTLCNLVLKGSQTGEYDSIDSEQASDVEVNYSNIINTESYTNTNIVTVDSLVSEEGIEYPLEMTPSWANTGVLLMTYKDYSTNGLLYPSGWSDLQNYDRYSIWADKNNNYHLYYQPYGYVNHIEVDPDITITWPPSIATSSYNDYSMFVGVDNEGSIKYDYMDRWYDVYMLIYYVGNGRFEYKMIYTDRYFEKLKLNSLNSIQTAVQSGAYYTKKTYLFLFDGLNVINDNLKTHFGISESNESVANNLLGSINANLSGLDSYLMGITSALNITHGKLDTIITKLDNLNIGGSSITPIQLTTVLTDLFVPHYQYIEPNFNEYKSQLGILALPFDYSTEVYDTIKSNYSDKMELTIPSASFKTDSSTEYTVMQGFDWEFEPETLFSENENIHSIFTSIQYLNAFLAILGASWFTYCHIFRRNETNDN